MYDEEAITWATDQMERIGVPDDHQELVKELLAAYWSSPLPKSLQGIAIEDFLKLFTELAQHHVIAPEAPEATWVLGKPGALTVRDVVRVRPDAYTGPAGTTHNGKVGVIVAIRSGDIHVHYDDATGANTVRHSPYALEKRI